MDYQKQVDLLRESLTRVLIVLNEVHGFAIMDKKLVRDVNEAMNDAESTLQVTDNNV